MAYCPQCGVELAPKADSCPLCFFDMNRIRSDACPDSSESPAPGIEKALGTPTKPIIIWEVFSVAALIAAVVVGGVNLLDSGNLSWSLYPLISLGFLWILFTAGLMAGKHLPSAIALAALSLPVFLVSIDAIENGLTWAFQIAVPIALVAELSVTGALVAIFRARRQGMNVIGYILIAASAICLGIEMTVDLAAGQSIHLYWSAVTTFTLIPMAAFLLYLHHRVVKKANLHKLLRF
ncbi:MAG: DUF6320 domain-containing protein [Rectinemataceae bacterium]|nr:DUF6320 domain-containing protein [Rectinemataceae bacterium]